VAADAEESVPTEQNIEDTRRICSGFAPPSPSPPPTRCRGYGGGAGALWPALAQRDHGELVAARRQPGSDTRSGWKFDPLGNLVGAPR
jgi:hypothetical protein